MVGTTIRSPDSEVQQFVCCLNCLLVCLVFLVVSTTLGKGHPWFLMVRWVGGRPEGQLLAGHLKPNFIFFCLRRRVSRLGNSVTLGPLGLAFPGRGERLASVSVPSGRDVGGW